MQDRPTPAPTPPRRALDPRSITRPDPALRTYYRITSAFSLILFPIVYLPLHFKYHSLRYRFDDDGVSMSWGRFFQRETYLTYKRIQDIRVTRGLLQRWLGLSELALQTASGGGNAEMKIEGIRDADALRDFLYERMRGARDDGEIEEGTGSGSPVRGVGAGRHRYQRRGPGPPGGDPGRAAPGEPGSHPPMSAPLPGQRSGSVPGNGGTLRSGGAVYQGALGTLARWLRVPLIPPSVPPGQPRWVRSFGPADSFLRYLKLQYLLLVGLLAVVLVPLSGLILFGLLRDGKALGAVALFLLVILPAVVWALMGYMALRFQFDTTWYVITDRAIRLRSGIWVLKELTVTFDNVQNVKIRQGPLQRWLGIGDVTIETAAVGAVGQHGTTVASTAVVAGIANSHEIRDRIVERMRASRSAGLGDPDDGAERRPRGGSEQRPQGEGGTRAARPSGGLGGWSPAHLSVLRELRDEVSRMG